MEALRAGCWRDEAVLCPLIHLSAKLPQTLPAFRHLASRCLDIVSDPTPKDLRGYQGLADPKDLPILVAALREKCSGLVTFNIRHYQPGPTDLNIVRPGEFILQVREHLARMRVGE